MTPAAAIADLDAALARRGETVRLQHVSLGPEGTLVTFEVAIRAQVRAGEDRELASTLAQHDSRVILSPTEIVRHGWPGPVITVAGVRPSGDPRIPQKGARVVTKRGVLTVEAAKPIEMADVLVRIVLLTRGYG